MSKKRDAISWTTGPRGHKIFLDSAFEWRYLDDGSLLWPNEQLNVRPCVLCKWPPTADLHDACLQEIPNVRFACCGHGIEKGYVSLEDGRRYRDDFGAVELWVIENLYSSIRNILLSHSFFYPTDFDKPAFALSGLPKMGVEEVMTSVRWGFVRRPRTWHSLERLLTRQGESRVVEVTQEAFANEDVLDRLKILTRLRGIQLATASILVTAQNPEIPLYSLYARQGLRNLKWFGQYSYPPWALRLSALRSQSRREYLPTRLFQDSCRELQKVSGLPMRAVDRALFVLGFAPALAVGLTH